MTCNINQVALNASRKLASLLIEAIQQLRPHLFEALFLRFEAIQPELQRSFGIGATNVHIAPAGMAEADDAFGEAIIRSGNSLE